MLEKLYDLIENQEGEESKSVMDFLAQFAVDEKTEDAFLAAVRDNQPSPLQACFYRQRCG